MDVVIDTSAIIAVITNEPERDTLISRTFDASLLAPASSHWEVGNAFSAMLKRRRITLPETRLALRNYERIAMRFVDIDLGQAVELADNFNIYAYDAYVAACAINFRCPLLTLDKGLIEVAEKIGIEVMETKP